MIWIKLLAGSFLIAQGLTLYKDKQIEKQKGKIEELELEITALKLTIAYYEREK